MITTSAVMDIVSTTSSKVVDSVVFGFCMFLLILLAAYIFIIFPHKADIINDQKSQIKKLERENKRLKKKVVVTK